MSTLVCHVEHSCVAHFARLTVATTHRYGQPPPEIIKEIAPGLELDEEGVPKLDGLGSLPFGENEECGIM